MMTGVDIFDGHVLVTEWDVRPECWPPDPEVDELVSHVEHPPTCEPTMRDPDGNPVAWGCAVGYHEDALGGDAWPEATSPGRRFVGWRHDVYGGAPWSGPLEHEVVAFTIDDEWGLLYPEERDR